MPSIRNVLIKLFAKIIINNWIRGIAFVDFYFLHFTIKNQMEVNISKYQNSYIKLLLFEPIHQLKI